MAIQNINLIPQDQDILNAINEKEIAALANLGQRIGAKGDGISIYNILVHEGLTTIFPPILEAEETWITVSKSADRYVAKCLINGKTMPQLLSAETNIVHQFLIGLFDSINKYANNKLEYIAIHSKYPIRYKCNENNPNEIYSGDNPFIVNLINNVPTDKNVECIYAKVKDFETKTIEVNWNINTINDEKSFEVEILYVYPYVDSNNYWVINDLQTDVYALGKDAGQPTLLILQTSELQNFDQNTNKDQANINGSAKSRIGVNKEGLDETANQVDNSHTSKVDTENTPLQNWLNGIVVDTGNSVVDGIAKDDVNKTENSTDVYSTSKTLCTVIYDPYDVFESYKLNNGVTVKQPTVVYPKFSETNQLLGNESMTKTFAFPSTIWINSLKAEKREQLRNALIVNISGETGKAITTFWKYDISKNDYVVLERNSKALTFDNFTRITDYVSNFMDAFEQIQNPDTFPFHNFAFDKHGINIKNETTQTEVGLTLTLSTHSSTERDGNTITLLPVISDYSYNTTSPTYWEPENTKFVDFNESPIQYDNGDDNNIKCNVPELDLGAVLTSHPNVVNSVSFLQGGNTDTTYSLHIGNDNARPNVFNVKGSTYAYNLSTQHLSENQSGTHLKPIDIVEFSDLQNVSFDSPIVKYYNIYNNELSELKKQIYNITLPMLYCNSTMYNSNTYGDNAIQDIEVINVTKSNNNINITDYEKLLICICENNSSEKYNDRYIKTFKKYDVYLNVTEFISRLQKQELISSDFAVANINIKGSNVINLDGVSLLKLQQHDLLNYKTNALIPTVNGIPHVLYIGNQVSLDIFGNDVVVKEIITNSLRWNDGVTIKYSFTGQQNINNNVSNDMNYDNVEGEEVEIKG